MYLSAIVPKQMPKLMSKAETLAFRYVTCSDGD
jgi:hypothetical protein